MDERVLRRVIRLAADLGDVYSSEDIPDWFFTPQRLANGRRPIDLIANDPDWEAISARLTTLRNGSYT